MTISNQSSRGTLSPCSGVFLRNCVFFRKTGCRWREAPQPHRSPEDPLEKLEQWIPRPESLFVLFAADQPNPFPQMREVFHQTARRLGYEPRLKREIADRQGRIIYEVFAVDALDPTEP